MSKLKNLSWKWSKINKKAGKVFWHHVESIKAKSFDETVAYAKAIVDKYGSESYALDC